MNCRECLDQLEQYVDRELSDAELEHMKRHFDDCPPCQDRYELQVNLKRVVRVCCEQEKAPPELREKLRQILY